MKSQDRDVKPRTWTQWEPNRRENTGRPGPECSACGLGRGDGGGNGTGTLRDFGSPPSSLGPRQCPSRPGWGTEFACLMNSRANLMSLVQGPHSENHGSEVTEAWRLGPWEKGSRAGESTAWDPVPRCPFCAHKSQRDFHRAPRTTWCREQCQSGRIPPRLALSDADGLCTCSAGVCTGFLWLGRQGRGKLSGRKRHPFRTSVLPPLTRRGPGGRSAACRAPALGPDSLLTPALPGMVTKLRPSQQRGCAAELVPATERSS